MKGMRFIICQTLRAMEASKKDLRLKYFDLRNRLKAFEIDEKSLAVSNQILKLDIWNKTYFHVFLSIDTQKEVNTEYILHVLHGKDKEILLSRSDFDSREMTHFLLTENTKIKKNKYNIPEPMDGIIVPVDKIEVVFVPLLAFDKFGNRVGYGKGFYDVFLSKCKPETIKIGLSFFESEEKILDIKENDIKLDYCINPSKIYKF
jgi:5-formyltetrahydrofolate cyclo-ligase